MKSSINSKTNSRTSRPTSSCKKFKTSFSGWCVPLITNVELPFLCYIYICHNEHHMYIVMNETTNVYLTHVSWARWFLSFCVTKATFSCSDEQVLVSNLRLHFQVHWCYMCH
jgi:hypothetical protein